MFPVTFQCCNQFHDVNRSSDACEYIYILSSCRVTSMDIHEPLSPLLPIVHRFWQVLRTISRILTELLCIGLSRSPCFSSIMCGVHRRTSLMSSSLLLQQCSACLVRLTWIVFVMRGRYYLPNPSARAGYDTRSIFKRSLTGLNSEFSFS